MPSEPARCFSSGSSMASSPDPLRLRPAVPSLTATLVTSAISVTCVLLSTGIAHPQPSVLVTWAVSVLVRSSSLTDAGQVRDESWRGALSTLRPDLEGASAGPGAGISFTGPLTVSGTIRLALSLPVQSNPPRTRGATVTRAPCPMLSNRARKPGAACSASSWMSRSRPSAADHGRVAFAAQRRHQLVRPWHGRLPIALMQPVVRRVEQPVRLSGQGVHQQASSSRIGGCVDVRNDVGQQVPGRVRGHRRVGYEDRRLYVSCNVTTGDLYSIRLVGEHKAAIDGSGDVVWMALNGVGVRQQPTLVTLPLGQSGGRGEAGHDGG